MSRLIPKLLVTALLLLCFGSALAQPAATDMVLVVHPEAELDALTSLELRKLFLGLPIDNKGARLVPIIYLPNQSAQDIFLQVIVGMTARSYDRKVLQSRLNFGSNHVPSEANLAGLMQRFNASGQSITFMTFADAQRFELKTVQILWQSEN